MGSILHVFTSPCALIFSVGVIPFAIGFPLVQSAVFVNEWTFDSSRF